MTVKQVEKQVKTILTMILKDYFFKEKYFFYNSKGIQSVKLSFDVKSFGGKIYLNLIIFIRINHIED